MTAHMLDVLTEATHGAAAGSDERPGSGGQNEKSEAIEGCFHSVVVIELAVCCLGEWMVAEVRIQTVRALRQAALLFLGIDFGLRGGSLGIGLLFVSIELRLVGSLLGFDIGLVDLGIDVRLRFGLFGDGSHGFLLMVDRSLGGIVLSVDGLFLLVATDNKDCSEGENGE